MKKSIGIILLLLVSVELCYALEASFSIEGLAINADRIVRGRVTSMSTGPGTNRYGDELILTNVSIHTSEALKGDRSDLVLAVEGGTFNGITLTVSDAPKFKVGEEVVVFAKKDLVTYRPVNGYRSKYTLAKNGILLENNVYYGTFKKEILQSLRRNRSSQ